jgi:hypothetical protein
MATGEEFLLRPVHRGMVRLTELLDGSLSLADVAWANEYLDVYDENSFRITEAMKE